MGAGDGAHDETHVGRLERPEAESHQTQGKGRGGVTGVRVQSGSQPQSHRLYGQARGTQAGRPHPVGQPAGEGRGNGGHHRGRKQQEAAHGGRVAQHVHRIVGDQQADGEPRAVGQQGEQVGQGERRPAEQVDVDHRGGDPFLGHEEDRKACGRGNGEDQDLRGGPAQVAAPAHRQEQAGDAQGQGGRAQEVEPFSRGRTPCGPDLPRSEPAQEQRGQGPVEVHAAPPEGVHQHAAQQRPQGEPRGQVHLVEPQRPSALGRAHGQGHQRRGGAEHQRRAQALEHPPHEQPGKGLGGAAHEEGCGAGQQADGEDAPVAEHVRQTAAAQQEAGIGQHVADHHPLDGHEVDGERARDGRERDVDGGVEGGQQAAEPGDEQGRLRPRRSGRPRRHGRVGPGAACGHDGFNSRRAIGPAAGCRRRAGSRASCAPLPVV